MPLPLPDHGWSMTNSGVAVVTNSDGSICSGASGIYFRDRRIVAGMRLLVDGETPRQLGGVRVGPSVDRLTYGYWTDAPDPQAVITRERSLADRYCEQLTVLCFRRPIDFVVEVEMEPGNATIYHLDEEICSDDDAEFVQSLLWTDGCSADGLTISKHVSVEPGEQLTFAWGLNIGGVQAGLQPMTSVTTSDRQLQVALDSAAWDLEALTVNDPRTGRFGRDALVTSMLTLLAGTDRALDTLDVLAAYQGTSHNSRTLEAPGRILHELRIGDMGVFDLEPGVGYYGSIDATPLFVALLAECLRWGAPNPRLQALLPAARSAMQWCREHVDQFGFVQSVPHEAGIENQGWKDSADSVVRPDGTVVREATTLVEVQGYVHQALCGLADLEDAVGESRRSAALREEADSFAQRFREHFEVGGNVHIAMALDAGGHPIAVRASNVGHLMSTNLIDAHMARLLAARLFSTQEFSGWGVRTLSADEAAFNPLGYHVGSVWPHDNAVLLRGLAHRALRAETVKLSRALIDLASAETHGLPELLGGFARTEFPDPVPYPASARPQAWAAAVPFQIVTSLLGLRPALHRDELRLRPLLETNESIIVDGLRLGERTLRIEATGSQAVVSGDTDGLHIVSE